jgi:hypothetical protein
VTPTAHFHLYRNSDYNCMREDVDIITIQ